MSIEKELFEEILKAIAVSKSFELTFIEISPKAMAKLIEMGARLVKGYPANGHYFTEVELQDLQFKAADFKYVDTEKPALSIERRNEIAYEILIRKLLKDGQSISNSTMRELGNLAKSTDVPIEELKIFEENLFHTLISRVFSLPEE
jgi:hypothetical protein